MEFSQRNFHEFLRFKSLLVAEKGGYLLGLVRFCGRRNPCADDEISGDEVIPPLSPGPGEIMAPTTQWGKGVGKYED